MVALLSKKPVDSIWNNHSKVNVFVQIEFDTLFETSDNGYLTITYFLFYVKTLPLSICFPVSVYVDHRDNFYYSYVKKIVSSLSLFTDLQVFEEIQWFSPKKYIRSR